MTAFETKVELALTSGYTTLAASRVWTDITAYVTGDPIGITRGRQDEQAAVTPSKCNLKLDNIDGRFTPENVAGAYYPNIKKGRPIRVMVRFPSLSATWFTRFTGYVDDWGVSWPTGSDTYAQAEISASSRSVRIASNAPLRSLVEEEYALDGPEAHYPLGEPEGATSAGNVSVNRLDPLVVRQLGTGGTLEFGAGTGPGTDGLSAPILTPAGTYDGLYLEGPIIHPADTDQVLTLEATFNTSSAPSGTIAALWFSAEDWIALYVNAAGKLEATVANGGDSTVVTSAKSCADGSTHHAAIRVVLDDAVHLGTPTLFLDGVAVTGAAVTFPVFAGNTVFFHYQLFVGYDKLAVDVGAGVFAGTLAHVAIFLDLTVALSNARLLTHYQAGATGFAGESSDARIRRYATYARVPDAEVVTETGLILGVAHVDTTGKTPLELMEKVRISEDGLLFDGRDGSLTFQSRRHRYNALSAVTLDIAAQEVEPDLSPRLDDQGMVNDLSASRPGGATLRAFDQASTDEYGFYRDSLELLTISDADTQAAADWRVSRFGVPRVKIPLLPVDLMTLTSTKVLAFLGVELGSRITLTNAPAQAPAATQDLFVEGTTETISTTAYDVNLNVTLATLSNVWQLDSSTLSVLGTSTTLAY